MGKEKKVIALSKGVFPVVERGNKKITRKTQMLIIAIHRLEEIHCHQNYMGREGRGFTKFLSSNS